MDYRALTPADVAGICDHTFLARPEAFRGQAADPLAAYEAAWDDFLRQTFALPAPPYAICVRHDEVEPVIRRLAAEKRLAIKVAATVGFPLGDRNPSALKLQETRWALDHGATEIDTVLRWRDLKSGDERSVAKDLAALRAATAGYRALLKVILEVCELTDDEIRRACRLCGEAGADFVKTSTGFGRGGATVHALRLMRESFAGGIKISGGVTAENLGDLLAAATGAPDGALDPHRIRIGESSLLKPASPGKD